VFHGDQFIVPIKLDRPACEVPMADQGMSHVDTLRAMISTIDQEPGQGR